LPETSNPVIAAISKGSCASSAPLSKTAKPVLVTLAVD